MANVIEEREVFNNKIQAKENYNHDISKTEEEIETPVCDHAERVINFHSLRNSYITFLADSNTPAKVPANGCTLVFLRASLTAV